MIFRAQTDISAPPQRVFDYVCDLARHGEWSTNTLRLEHVGDAASGAGSRWRSRGRQLGIDNPNQLTVTEYDPPRRFAFEAQGREGRFRHVFELSPSDGGTHVIKRFEALESSLLVRLLAPLFAWMTPRGLAGDLRRIKARLEASES